MSYLIKNILIVMFCAVTVINSERWYPASIFPTETNLESSRIKATLNKTPTVDSNYLPLSTIIKHKNGVHTLKWHFHNHNEHKNKDHNTTVVPTEHMIHQVTSSWDYSKSSNATNMPTRPTRKVIRRCPSVRSKRKDQGNMRQAKTAKFLEVFEVVQFEHVTCTSSSGLEGTCLHEYDCQIAGGSTMGTCADGYGTCCVIQFSCDGSYAAPVGWFTNSDFPAPSTERISCAVTLEKHTADVKQIRLDFLYFEVLPPSSGTCEEDQFVVSGQDTNNIIPILCGINTGQHGRNIRAYLQVLSLRPSQQTILCCPAAGHGPLPKKAAKCESDSPMKGSIAAIYIEVGNVGGPVTLSLQTVIAEKRLYAIKVTQLSKTDDLAAPTGCLQYYKDTTGYLQSFNYQDNSDIGISRYPSYLNNLNYAMCIERTPTTCSITYTNAGDMQILNYDTDGLPVIPPRQAGVEIFDCPSDWLLISAIRLCGERLNDGSVLQDFSLDAPVTDNGAGPIVVWFRSDGGYVGRGFKLYYLQNSCTVTA